MILFQFSRATFMTKDFEPLFDHIIGTYTSTPKPLGPKGVPSAMKKKLNSKLTVSSQSIQGDDCYNKKYHGGAHRVIHHYSLKNYQKLQKCFPEISERFYGGSYGENILTKNFDEKDLCVGDIFQIGSVKAQLTIPRSPCATINLAYEHKKVLKSIIDSGHFGWFYKVLEPGTICAGDTIELLERPFPQVNLHELIKQAYTPAKVSEEDFQPKLLELALKTNCLNDSWTKKVTKALSRQTS